MIELYPPIEPYASGSLAVGDGNVISWEECGAPAGKPALVLHGGPGQGRASNMRRGFDPRKYRVVLFDQRGCGQSTPHASDPSTDMMANTTEHLIADIEALRRHLEIDRWLVYGGSWGATLALAYSQRHPSRVTEIVLQSVTTSSRSESEWLYAGAARFFPEAWEDFRGHVPEAAGSQDVVTAYSERMESPVLAVRLAAARAWCAREDSVLSLEPHAPPSPFSQMSPRDLLAFVRICAHYVRHAAWLEEGALLRDAARLHTLDRFATS